MRPAIALTTITLLSACGGDGEEPMLEVSKLEAKQIVSESLADHSVAIETAIEDIDDSDIEAALSVFDGSCGSDAGPRSVFDSAEASLAIEELRANLLKIVDEGNGTLDEDGTTIRYPIKPVDACGGEHDCEVLFSETDFVVRVTKPGDGALRIYLDFDDDGVEKSIGSFRMESEKEGADENSMAAEWDVGGWVDLGKRLAGKYDARRDGANFSAVVPEVFKGILGVGLDLPSDGGLTLSFYSPDDGLEISGFSGDAAGTAIKIGAFNSASTINGKQLTESFESGGFSVSVPASGVCGQRFSGESEVVGYTSVDRYPLGSDTQPYPSDLDGQQDVSFEQARVFPTQEQPAESDDDGRLLCSPEEEAELFTISNAPWSLEGQFSAETNDFDIDNVNAQSLVALNIGDKKLMAIDAVNLSDLKVDFKHINGRLRIGFSKPVGIQFAMMFSEFERATKMELPSWLADTVFDIMLDGEPRSEIWVPAAACESYAPGQGDADVAEDQFKVGTGKLTIKSVSQSEGTTEFVATDGQCVDDGNPAADDRDLVSELHTIECLDSN